MYNKTLKNSLYSNANYNYLISGVDIPLKSQDFIHNFYKENQGKEFVTVIEDWDKSRIQTYVVFNELGKKQSLSASVGKFINKMYSFV